MLDSQTSVEKHDACLSIQVSSSHAMKTPGSAAPRLLTVSVLGTSKIINMQAQQLHANLSTEKALLYVVERQNAGNIAVAQA